MMYNGIIATGQLGLCSMTQEQAKQLLQQGIATARSGRPDVARGLLQQAVRLDPQNETIWLWLSSVAKDDKERLFCLRQLLEINPQNEFALKGLHALGAITAEAAPSKPGTTVPVMDQDKYVRIQQTLDEVLRRYNPEPPYRLDVDWVRKSRGRYTEGGARRLRVMAYAAAALTVIVLVGVVGLAVTSLGVLDDDSGAQVAVAPTRRVTLTPTATMTPTPGGATPTPFPQQMAIPATPTLPVNNLEQQGSIYGTPNPTDVYPAPHPNIAGIIDGAIDLYSVGQYADAIATLENERTNSGDHCYPAVVYYEAMSYAAQGGVQNLDTASQLLEEALAHQPPTGSFSTCRNAPLVLAGLADVRFRQGNYDQALNLSGQALDSDPKLVTAMLTKGRVQMMRGQLQDAWRTVSAGLGEAPSDTNLLLMMAEIEIANNNPNTALEYIGQALYVEPVLQPGLRLQAQAYLLWADISFPPADTSPEARIQLYSMAVRSAQTLLLYYAGDPEGYLLLAKARLGEGNADLAETALTRLIGVEENLPEDAAPVLAEAYRLRGDLLYEQGRLVYEKERLPYAQDDYEKIAFDGGSDVLEKLMNIAFAKGNFDEATIWLNELLRLEPGNPRFLLDKARVEVELCTLYPDTIACAYGDTLDLLNDTFIAGLGASQQADAYALRAQARYWNTQRQGSTLNDGEQQLNYQLALSDITQALSVRERAVDHYIRGLILEETGDFSRALDEYLWVDYWNDLYDYPFDDEDFEDRVDSVTERVEAGPPVEPPPDQPAEVPTGEPGAGETLEPPTEAPAEPDTPTVPPTVPPAELVP